METAAHRPDAPFDGLLGIEHLDDGPDGARARVAVRPELLQPLGVVHGGVLATLAESLASRASWLAVRDEGLQALGQSSSISFVRPISAGHVNAIGHVRHRGRTTWVWDVELTDDEGRLCALARLTIAVRPAPVAD
jgi:uncharacterized protein (TIGR00369 family)